MKAWVKCGLTLQPIDIGQLTKRYQDTVKVETKQDKRRGKEEKKEVRMKSRNKRDEKVEDKPKKEQKTKKQDEKREHKPQKKMRRGKTNHQKKTAKQRNKVRRENTNNNKKNTKQTNKMRRKNKEKRYWRGNHSCERSPLEIPQKPLGHERRQRLSETRCLLRIESVKMRT